MRKKVTELHLINNLTADSAVSKNSFRDTQTNDAIFMQISKTVDLPSNEVRNNCK